MQEFVIMLLICSATMSALGLIYVALTPLLASRYSANSRYYAWLIIVIGLIIPLRPSLGVAIVKYDLPSESISPTVLQSNANAIASPSGITALPNAPSISLWQIAALIWLIGAITFIVCHAIQHYRFTRTVNRWSESVAHKQSLPILESIKSEMGITRKIGLYQCPSIGGPTLLGFANTRILLPHTDFSPDELRFILKHELTHYKRGDLFYKYGVLLAAAIHWFNPIVYLLSKAIDAACELSCDAETVRDADAEARRQYGEMIIGVVRYQSKMKTALSTNFYGGKQGMKKRIYSIMDTGKKKTGVVILCSVLILTFGTGMAFAANTGEQKNTPANQLDRRSNTQTVTETDHSMMSRFDTETGKTYYSWDLGKTWIHLTDVEYDAMFPTPVIEWWTYDGYKEWMDEQIKSLQTYADDGVPDYYDKNNILRDFTQDDVDEFAASCRETLNNLKNGFRVSKTIDGSSDTVMTINPQDMAVGVTETYAIASGSENTVTEYDYSKYIPFGLAYDKPTRTLYYKGERVRYFEDSYPIGENMGSYINHFDEKGSIDVYAVRDLSNIVRNPDGSYDPSGVLVGVEPYSQAEFDARDIDALLNPPQTVAETNVENTASYSAPQASLRSNDNTTATNTVIAVQSAESALPSELGRSFEQIFEAYADYGITFETNSRNGGLGNVYYNGKLVKGFVDLRPDGSVTSVSSSDGGKLTVRTVYDVNGKLSGLHVTEE